MSKIGLAAPCEGFAGVMSCQCRRDCAALLAVHGFAKRSQQFSAADLAPCWTAEGLDIDRRTSALPSNASVSVRFWTSWETQARLQGALARNLPSHFRAAANLIRLDVADVPRNSSLHSWGSQPAWVTSARMLRIEPTGALEYMPNERCPGACSSAGSCAAGGQSDRRNDAARTPRCLCHAGHGGASCNESRNAACLHGCSDHGRCFSRMCLCDDGYHGLDCSLSYRGGATASLDAAAADGVGRTRLPRHAPMYVVPLPNELFGLHHHYQGRQTPLRGMYEASRLFLERLHRRRELVARPEEAVLFYVPLLLVQAHGCIWEPQRYLAALVEYFSTTPPWDFYWRRHRGADFVFFTTQDMVCSHAAKITTRCDPRPSALPQRAACPRTSLCTRHPFLVCLPLASRLRTY